MDNYILLITFVLFSHSTFSQVIIFIIPFTNRNYLYSKTQFLIQSLLLLLLLDIITILNSQNFYQFYYQILNYYLFITNYFTHFQTQTTLSRKIFPGILIPSYPSKFLPPLLKFHPYNDNDQRCSLPRLVNPGSSGPELELKTMRGEILTSHSLGVSYTEQRDFTSCTRRLNAVTKCRRVGGAAHCTIA